MKCPICKLENPPNSVCDCGYDFSTKVRGHSYVEYKKPSTLITFGWIFAILGGWIGLAISANLAFSSKYDYGSHNGKILHEKVHRCFASLDIKDGALYKKHKSKTSLDKTASTPEHCFIINDDINEIPIPNKLDKQWYIDLAEKRVKEFLGG